MKCSHQEGVFGEKHYVMLLDSVRSEGQGINASFLTQKWQNALSKQVEPTLHHIRRCTWFQSEHLDIKHVLYSIKQIHSVILRQ